VLGYQEVQGEMGCSDILHNAVEEWSGVTLAAAVGSFHWGRCERRTLHQARTAEWVLNSPGTSRSWSNPDGQYNSTRARTILHQKIVSTVRCSMLLLGIVDFVRFSVSTWSQYGALRG